MSVIVRNPPHNNCFMALFPGPPAWAEDQQRQTHRPSGWAPLHPDYPVPTSTILHIFCRPDALPAAQPTALKHWTQYSSLTQAHKIICYYFDISRMWVCFVAATVMLLTSLLVFADNSYCATSNCLFSPIHWIQLFVSIEVAACLLFLTVYLGKFSCLPYLVLYSEWAVS